MSIAPIVVAEGRKKMEFKPLMQLAHQTDELKKLIAEHPDYPIVVLCSTEVVADDFYTWWYAPCLSFDVGELLDCEQEVNEERYFTDREEFEGELRDKLSYQEEYEKLSDGEFDKVLKAELEKYEPYWTKVIMIRADV